MSSNQKHSSLGWTLAISLGIAFSAGVVQAGSIGDPDYTAGETLTAAKMQNIKNAVNDNDTRIGAVIANTQAGALKTAVDGNTADITALDGRVTTNEADITALQNGTPTCATGTTAVGPICVDDTRAGPNVAWITAVDTCRDAGKRLLTPGEYMAAKRLGTILDMTNFEWVDSVSSNAASDSNLAGGIAGRLVVGYMGPSLGQTGVTDGDIFFGNNADYDDATLGFIYYRCAR